MSCRSLTLIHHEINGAQDASNLLLVADRTDKISVSLTFSLIKKQCKPRLLNKQYGSIRPILILIDWLSCY